MLGFWHNLWLLERNVILRICKVHVDWNKSLKTAGDVEVRRTFWCKINMKSAGVVSMATERGEAVARLQPNPALIPTQLRPFTYPLMYSKPSHLLPSLPTTTTNNLKNNALFDVIARDRLIGRWVLTCTSVTDVTKPFGNGVKKRN